MMSSTTEDGATVTVRNPLLVVMQAQAEKEKIRERRRKIRAERRKDRERRRGTGQVGGHVRPTTYTPPPPLLMPSASSSSSSNGGVSFSKKNADINYDVKIVGPKVPWEHKGSKAPSSSSTSSTKGRGMAANGKGASNSDSEVGTRRGKATKEEMANGNAAMSPAQQLLMRMYQKKQPQPGKEEEASRAAAAAMVVQHSPQQEKLVAEVAKRVHEASAEGHGGHQQQRTRRRNEEYLVESDLHEICDWLASLKLPVPDYLEPLVMEGFDNMNTIRLLQEEDLIKHVGINKTGHRKKIMYWVHRNRPEGYFDMMSDGEQEDDDQDDYNIMSELNWSSSDSSAAT
ncbi:SAM domain (Sterile alpha motif) domain containing protein [Acanthamoeba castellanii str. Neff]|uniref:SAM domain (Sterile alpha motif) domain containing protein n=1 Tax=Acanthamoeba castellanii (strain ATCC 30010 / Neff) TaxID=1257118 RepID=L8HAM1_ACACF|nr:SAM domain (Sterile alpha motif) domain containing protein [Acanthamoeba castellanii str. Neff]ELR22235.1 SAM domain (Sterile alpha motif) domain containing protein [Acanthamoeba castellanii str. Neff]